MDTHGFLDSLRKDLKPMPIMSLFTTYCTGVAALTKLSGAKMTTIFLVGGMFVGFFMAFRPPLRDAFMRWWDHFSTQFHITLTVLELSGLLLYAKGIAWLLDLNPERESKKVHYESTL